MTMSIHVAYLVTNFIIMQVVGGCTENLKNVNSFDSDLQL